MEFQVLALNAHAADSLATTFVLSCRQVMGIENGNATKIIEPGSGRELLTIKDRAAGLFSAALDARGLYLVTVNRDGPATVWSAPSGTLLFTLTGHRTGLFSAVFSPDGRRVVTASSDGTVKVWDVETGRELLTLRGPANVTGDAGFSRDGLQLAIVRPDSKAIVWNALPWRDEDLPGDASMSYQERTRLYILEQSKKRGEKKTEVQSEKAGGRTPQ